MSLPFASLLLASTVGASAPLTIIQTGVVTAARSGAGSVSQPLAGNITLPSGHTNTLLLVMALAQHDVNASVMSLNWDAAGTPAAMTKQLTDRYTTANSLAANGCIFSLANPLAGGVARPLSLAGTFGFWNATLGYIYCKGHTLSAPLEGLVGSANPVSSATSSIDITNTTAKAIKFFGTSFQGHDGYNAGVPNPTTPAGYTLIGRGNTATNSLTTDASYGFWYKQVAAATTETVMTTFATSDGRGIVAGVIK